MKRGLADLSAIQLLGFHPRGPVPRAFLSPVICCDAAAIDSRYQAGLFSPHFGLRLILCPHLITTQQQAELFALDCSLRLAVRLGWDHVTIVSDNTGALLALHNLRPAISNSTYCTIVRRCFNRLLWSKLTVTLSWVPSPLQPADPVSRHRLSSTFLEPSMRRLTWERWKTLLSCLSSVRIIGVLAL